MREFFLRRWYACSIGEQIIANTRPRTKVVIHINELCPWYRLQSWSFRNIFKFFYHTCLVLQALIRNPIGSRIITGAFTCRGIDVGFEDGEANHHGCIDHFRGTIVNHNFPSYPILTWNYEVGSHPSQSIMLSPIRGSDFWPRGQEANNENPPHDLIPSYSVTNCNAIVDSFLWDNQTNHDFHSLASSHTQTLPFSPSNNLWTNNDGYPKPYISKAFIHFSSNMELIEFLFTQMSRTNNSPMTW